MTQHDAKTAARHLQRKIREVVTLYHDAADDTILVSAILSLREDIDDFAKQLETSKPAQPNCRRATPEELDTLCHASNVVLFPAVA